MSSRHEKLARLAEALLGRKVERIERPGGGRRQSCRLILDDGASVIATRRDGVAPAGLEVRVLRALGSKGVPVPAVLAARGDLLVQSHLDGPRLSEALDAAPPERVEALLDAAFASLARLHDAGSSLGLDATTPKRGHERPWIETLIDRPAAFSRLLGLTAPDLPRDGLLALFSVERPRFVKWDARPGNAILTAGGVAWFDFEDCGSRNRLDDIAWLIGDEFTPDLPEVEARLLERHLPTFADGPTPDEARRYLYAYGAFHTLIRLGLILRRKDDGPWWDHAYCLSRDKPGVTHAAAMRLCRRGARWAAHVPELRPLAAWFGDLAAVVPEDARAPGPPARPPAPSSRPTR